MDLKNTNGFASPASTSGGRSTSPGRPGIVRPNAPWWRMVRRGGAPMPGGKVRYGSDLVVDLLHLYDIPYVSMNPGSSFRGLHDSLVNYGDNKPEMIPCQHEEIAVAIAHGYAKATGKPMAA